MTVSSFEFLLKVKVQED
ncbi:Protein of unknown function [Bacillus cereus]|nr:Protein of unknown function [Bacillus cereus]